MRMGTQAREPSDENQNQAAGYRMPQRARVSFADRKKKSYRLKLFLNKDPTLQSHLDTNQPQGRSR